MTARRAYRLAEMAEQLGIHPETLRLAAARGEVPARKLGGQWLFATDAMDAWLHNAQRDEEAPDARRRIDLPAGGRQVGGAAVDRGPGGAPLPEADPEHTHAHYIGPTADWAQAMEAVEALVG